jgi:glyoxylase-like metal-dependent hydrolase (beta-lactamase superfamily II)
MIRLKVFSFNPLQVNLWLLYEENGSGILIDPSAFEESEFGELDQFVKEHNIALNTMINTHGHFDHVFGSGRIREKYGVRFMIHKGDNPLLASAELQAAAFGFRLPSPVPAPDAFLEDGAMIRSGNIELKVIHVPGHSPGCVAFYQPENGWLFTGDTLFAGSIGRTDLPGGDYDQILRSIKEKLYILPDETEVLPGHGPKSTLGREKRTNPFVRE